MACNMLFPIFIRLFRREKADAQSPSLLPEPSPPLQIPFLVAPTGATEARALLKSYSIADLKATYSQSLAIARKMLGDGTYRQDIPGFTALCFGLDLLGSAISTDLSKCHFLDLQRHQSHRKLLADDGTTDVILHPRKPKRKERDDDNDI